MATTNVPENLREMWADLYRLFDINYLMENNEESWNKFWNQAMKLQIKHGSPSYFISMVTIISDMISERMRSQQLEEDKKNSKHLEDMNLF